MTCNLFNQQGSEENQGDSHKVHQRADPGSASEEYRREKSDNRNFGAAGHKGRQHGGRSSFPFIPDRTACHNSRDPASCCNDKRNDGFSGKADSFENRVHYNADTSHITAVFQQSNQEVHYHYQRQEAYYRAYAAYNAVRQQRLQER